MQDKLVVRKEKAEGKWTVVLDGLIAADAYLEQSLVDVSGPVRMNLRGVRGIDSAGVRQWISAVRALEARGSIEYEDVSVAMIRQFNMILNARGKAKVLSFYAPYFCKTCDHERQVLLVPAEDPENLGRKDYLKAPEQTCKICGHPLEFDDLPEKYFHFLEIQLAE